MHDHPIPSIDDGHQHHPSDHPQLPVMTIRCPPPPAASGDDDGPSHRRQQQQHGYDHQLCTTAKPISPSVHLIDANPASETFLLFLFFTAPALMTTVLPPPPASTTMAATPSPSIDDYGGCHCHQRWQSRQPPHYQYRHPQQPPPAPTLTTTAVADHHHPAASTPSPSE